MWLCTASEVCRLCVRHGYISISASGVGAQGDLCTATIF